MKEFEPRQCEFCGDTFTPHIGKQRFDTRDCQVRAERQRRWEQRQAEKLAAAEREAKAIPGLAKLLPPAQ